MKILKKIITNLIFLIILFLLLFKLGDIFIENYAQVNINHETFNQNLAETNIYDKDDNLVYTFSKYSIDNVDYDDINPYYFKSLIALEDENFYKHDGVDYISMIKSVIRTIIYEGNYGGSTITMQLAKNIYMEDWMLYDEEGLSKHDTKPIAYKLTQMSIAKQIEKEFTKEEIIEAYANNVFFGDGGYGISSASERFFHKKPKDLTLRESMILAAIPNNPYGFSPYSNLDGLNNRVNYGLSLMLDDNIITKEEYDKALKEKPKFYEIKVNDKENEFLVDYLDALIKELYDINPDLNIYTADLNIYTGLDVKAQENMEKTLKDKSHKQNGVQQGAISINPKNGEIMAIGSRVDNEEILGGYNLATELSRQPGSSIKPILDYAPAIDKLGYSKDSIVNDKPTSYTGGPSVYNYNRSYIGQTTLKYALAQSLNTVALQLFQEMERKNGLSWYQDYLQSLNFKDYKDVNEAYAIGGFTDGTSPLEMAGAYQIFANDGKYNTPHIIRKINVKETSPYYKVPKDYSEPFGNFKISIKQTSKEDEVFTFDMNLIYTLDTKQIIQKHTADEITNILSVNYSGSLLKTLGIKTKNVSAKTGTSNVGNNARDTWVVGYSPNEVVAVWNGFENGEAKIDELGDDNRETFKKIIDRAYIK